MNKTTNFDLPLYEANDITSWMGENGFNGAMTKIDTGMAQNAAAASGAQSTANNANTIATTANRMANMANENAKNAVFKLTSLNYTPSFNPQAPGYNLIHAALDSKKQILLLNGSVSIEQTDNLSQNLGKININKPQINAITMGCVVYGQKRDGSYGVNTFGGFSVLQDGSITRISVNWDNNYTRLWIVINCALNVSEWGIYDV